MKRALIALVCLLAVIFCSDFRPADAAQVKVKTKYRHVPKAAKVVTLRARAAGVCACGPNCQCGPGCSCSK